MNHSLFNKENITNLPGLTKHETMHPNRYLCCDYWKHKCPVFCCFLLYSLFHLQFLYMVKAICFIWVYFDFFKCTKYSKISNYYSAPCSYKNSKNLTTQLVKMLLQLVTEYKSWRLAADSSSWLVHNIVQLCSHLKVKHGKVHKSIQLVSVTCSSAQTTCKQQQQRAFVTLVLS